MAIIRIPRSNGSDERESFVLVNVRKAGGSRSLDLKLVATDGSEPFEVTGSSSNFHLISINMATLDAKLYAHHSTC